MTAGRPPLPELAGFALAGGAAYAADLGLFVWLRGPGGPEWPEGSGWRWA